MQDQKLAPPPRRALSPPPSAMVYAPDASGERFTIARGKVSGPQRIVIYGPGGIGKSSLSALAPAPIFIDIEEGTRELDVARAGGIDTWEALRACLHSSAFHGFQTVVIDTMTRAGELAVAHTIATVKHEKGGSVARLEDYGFGKGYQHAYEVSLNLLNDCDAQIRDGRNVIMICHDCTSEVPNPAGENYIRWEPDLQTSKSGKASTRNRVVQWADHVLRLGYDVNVTKDGKGRGSGTRTIWTDELPQHVAKSRSVHVALAFESARDDRIWKAIFDGGLAA